MSIIAAAVASVLRAYITELCDFLLDGLADKPYLIPVISGLTPLLLATICPTRMAASLRSILLFPRHVGICLRAMIGILLIVVADLALFGTEFYYQIDTGTAMWALGAFVITTVLGYRWSTWLEAAGQPGRQADETSSDELQSVDPWLAGDEPIMTLADSRFPEYESVANRILTKLLSERNSRSWLVPNVVLVGPYGSGKTSICNLVESLYLRRTKKEKLAETLFCRFEAWQFLSPEAATTGLVRTVTEKILEVTDELSLWSVPDHYVEVIKQGGWRWVSPLVPFLGASDDPGHVLSRIGDTLARLDLRVVIFVDDFDRIEQDSPATQQAVVEALNQFQGMPNLQYVITIGPTIGHGQESTERHVSWDLLKLTRYQERVPTFETKHLVEQTRKYRDLAQKDNECYFPWAYTSENDTDPLRFHPEFEHFYSEIGLIGKLNSLVNTPRACKGMLRETVKSWKCGLKGEIDWYDLLLLNAIKSSEPGVFEWIARDPNVFLDDIKPLPVGERERVKQEEQEKKYARELQSQLESAVSSREPCRLEVVKKALAHLFPSFNAKLEPGIVGHHTTKTPDRWSQRISRSDYLQRFLAGSVPPTDVPDQPTLQYIKRIIKEDFDPNHFVQSYLNTYEKMTGPLNKVVQFATLIPRNLAFQICDTMLNWIADPTHAAMWPEPERFMMDNLPDVFNIIDHAESVSKRSVMRDEIANKRHTDELYIWIESVIKRYMPEAPLLSLSFAQNHINKGSLQSPNQLSNLVFKEFRCLFIEKKQPLLPGLIISRYSLAWLLNDLAHIISNEEYATIKSDLTKTIVAQAEGPDGQQMVLRIITSLVETSHPARSGEIRLDEYEFRLNQNANENRYDMKILLAFLQSWSVTQSDTLTEKALAFLKREYGLA